MQTRVLQVRGMSCGHCADAVKGALLDVPGVVAAAVNLENGQVSVNLIYDVATDVLAAVIDEVGYAVEG